MEDALHAVRDRGGRTQLLHVRGRQVMSFTALHAWLSGRSREDLAPTSGGSWEDLTPSLIPLSCGRCTQVRRTELKFGPRACCPGLCADPGETFRKPGETRKVVGDPVKPCPCYAERCPGPASDWLPRGDLMRKRRKPLGNAPAVCPTRLLYVQSHQVKFSLSLEPTAATPRVLV